jgi:hypothetical protein
MNRKASLELSIQAIVIVVIAFVVLGLGLGFVRGQFKSMEETASGVQEQIKQQILDDLRTSNKKLSFPASEMKMTAGELSSAQGIGIKNTLDSMQEFLVGFEVRTDVGMETFMSFETLTASQPGDSGSDFDAIISWDDSPQMLGAGDSVVVTASFTAPSSFGNYLYKILVYIDSDGDGLLNKDTDTYYDSKTFFIRVN